MRLAAGSGLVAALALFAATSEAQPPPENVGSANQRLVRPADVKLWTENNRHVPMCWHQMVGFPSAAAENAAKDFVARTIQAGWIDLIDLRISWVDCPTSGPAKHVRAYLRMGDNNFNGTTLEVGMATLSTAAQRMTPPPGDPPGLLMGFRSDWNSNDGTRADFRGLVLHEFGHILGFGHEGQRADDPPAANCYADSLPSGIVTIGPVDPTSIMGWSYCTTALDVLSENDVAAVRSVYGIKPVSVPCPGVSAGCAITETSSLLLLLD